MFVPEIKIPSSLPFKEETSISVISPKFGYFFDHMNFPRLSIFIILAIPSSLFVLVAVIAKELSSVISLIVIPDREFFIIISLEGFLRVVRD